MNKILSAEAQRLKKMMKNNNIFLTEDDDDDDTGANGDSSLELSRNANKAYSKREDRIEEIEESRGSYLSENAIDNSSNKISDKKPPTNGRPPVKKITSLNADEYNNIKNVSKPGSQHQNNSPQRKDNSARNGSRNRKEVKSEVDKIRNEIAHAQDVINSLQIPPHLQEKITCNLLICLQKISWEE